MKRLTVIFIALFVIVFTGFSQNYLVGIFNDDNLELTIETASPQRTQDFILKIKNTGFQTAVISWDESSMTGIKGETTKLLLSDYINYSDSPQIETLIEPNEEVIVRFVPFNAVYNGKVEQMELSERVISMFLVYTYSTERKTFPLRIRFPEIKEKSTFEKVMPWVIAGAGTALIVGIIFWPRGE